MPATKMLKDSAGNDFYPVTHAAAVVRDSGTLEEALASIPTKNSQIENDAGHLTSVGTADINDKAVTTAKIADKAVTSAQIADATVTQSNINWSTISYVEDTTFKAGAQKTVNTTKSSLATLTVPVGGVYLITLSFDINAQGYYLADSNINITAGSTSLVDRYINNNARDYWLGGFSTTITATLAANTVVTAYAKTSQNQFVIPAGGSRRHFSAVRIA